MNQDERNKLIEEYGNGYELLTDTLTGIPREAWEFKPAPKEWSIRETLGHIKDSESLGVVRLHKLIAEPGSTLMTYQEDKWAEALGYQNQDPDDALQLFKLTRKITYRLLKNLSDQAFTYSVIHSEYEEPYTVEKWLGIYIRHIPEHLGQLQITYAVWKEQNK